MLYAAAHTIVFDSFRTTKSSAKERSLRLTHSTHELLPPVHRKADDDCNQHAKRYRKRQEHGDYYAYCKVDSKPHHLIDDEPFRAIVHFVSL